MALNRIPNFSGFNLHNITFPVRRVDGPTSYDYARIADANDIPLLDVLKHPAVGVDGSEFADFLVLALNEAGKDAEQ